MNDFVIELIRPWKKSDYDIHYALFDFDGTVSLIRQGWQDIMTPYFVEELMKLNTGESVEEITELCRNFITDLTGKQTIFQCIALAEEISKRGGTPQDPMAYKEEYLRRLASKIRDRKEALRDGTASPIDWTVPGVIEFLKALQERGIPCYLASGTDEKDVKEEAHLLQVDQYFNGGIYGARDELLRGRKKEEITDIKAEVIRRMLEDQKIEPHELVSFGDGFMEIELVASIDGLTIGVATNEKERKGIDEWKKTRLVKAGARVIIPDFSCRGDVASVALGVPLSHE